MSSTHSKYFCSAFRATAFVGVITFLAATSESFAAEPGISGTGLLPGGVEPRALGVSPDGSVVVGGRAWYTDVAPAFYKPAGGNLTTLGTLPQANVSSAYAASAAGVVIVGESSYVSPSSGGFDQYYEAFRWTRTGGMVGLGYLGTPHTGSFSTAQDVSADGSVIVGYSGSRIAGAQAFQWTETNGMVGLGYLPSSGTPGSGAVAVSADGSVVVGSSSSTNSPSDSYQSGSEAFRWTARDGMIGLGDLPGGAFRSLAYDVSADGGTIVGVGNYDRLNGGQAFRWTDAGGMLGLDLLPGWTASVAQAVSADGSMIVGSGGFGLSNAQAFLWTEADGTRRLADVLVSDYGIDLGGWMLQEALGISDDGSTIVGYGINPQGLTEGWVVTFAPVPVPAALPLMLSGLAVLGLGMRRERNKKKSEP